MIQFSITLSVNQIACLRAIRSDVYKPCDKDTLGISHWITGTRLLLAEKLVTHDTTPLYTKDGRPNGIVGWNITEKGRALLRVIELDIMDAAQAIEETEKAMRTPLPQATTVEVQLREKEGEGHS